MARRHAPSRRGFTLLEALMCVVVLAVVAASILPVMASLNNSYAKAREGRDAAEFGQQVLETTARFLQKITIEPAGRMSYVFTRGASFTMPDGSTATEWTFEPAKGDDQPRLAFGPDGLRGWVVSTSEEWVIPLDSFDGGFVVQVQGVAPDLSDDPANASGVVVRVSTAGVVVTSLVTPRTSLMRAR